MISPTSIMETYSIRNGTKWALNRESISINGVVGAFSASNPFPFLESILYIARDC